MGLIGKFCEGYSKNLDEMQKGHPDIRRICSLEKINKNGIIIFTLGKRIHWRFFYEVILKTNTYTLEDLFCKSRFFFWICYSRFYLFIIGSQSLMQESYVLRVTQGWRGGSLPSNWLLLVKLAEHLVQKPGFQSQINFVVNYSFFM